MLQYLCGGNTCSNTWAKAAIFLPSRTAPSPPTALPPPPRQALTSCDELRSAALLVLANKQDLDGAMTAVDITQVPILRSSLLDSQLPSLLTSRPLFTRCKELGTQRPTLNSQPHPYSQTIYKKGKMLTCTRPGGGQDTMYSQPHPRRRRDCCGHHAPPPSICRARLVSYADALGRGRLNCGAQGEHRGALHVNTPSPRPRPPTPSWPLPSTPKPNTQNRLPRLPPLQAPEIDCPN